MNGRLWQAPLPGLQAGAPGRTCDGGGLCPTGVSAPASPSGGPEARGLAAGPEKGALAACPVVSVSRRTDVPAWYARWFMERVRQGFCEWVNPFGGQRRRVSLRPGDVAAFVFWTRNPAPLMPHLAELERQGYTFYFHFTLNGYPRTLEPFRPPVELSVRRFRELAHRIGPHRVFWRYDPIVLGHGGGLQLDFAYHLDRFERLARALAGSTGRCYVSFVNLYRKTRNNLRQSGLEAVAAVPEESRRELARQMAEAAARFGIALYACCDDALVDCPGCRPARAGGALAGAETGALRSHEGRRRPECGPTGRVHKARCVDPDVLEALREGLGAHLAARPTREQCGCFESVDIGAYDTCLFGCAYCYATRSNAIARARYRRHQPYAPVLAPDDRASRAR